MAYSQISIKEMMEKISHNEVYLPVIQREFVWKPEQIEKLFDSIMKNYPIGLFLFWYVRGKKRYDYIFYKFIQDYHERDRYKNEPVGSPELKKEIIGILDGQQRLGGLYLALQGTYAFKKPYLKWNNPKAYPKRKFYLNLLNDPEKKEEGEKIYEFRFLTNYESNKIDKNQLWLLVSDVLKWGQNPKIDDYYENLLDDTMIPDEIKEHLTDKEIRSLIKNTLRILHQKLILENQISYFKIENEDLDDILEIFIRVNSGGTILGKSDLLFSTIAGHWDKGREEIEDFLDSLNKKGDSFNFDKDFIMRSCLVLTDSPIIYKVKGFKKQIIDKIRENWSNIKDSIDKTVDLLIEFGFNRENLTSLNSIIPISYYFIMGGNDTKKSKKEIRKYLIHALLMKVYGGQPDQVLSKLREVLKNNEKKYFSFNDFISIKLPANKSIKINDEDIEAFLQLKKGPYTFMILSLLYPSLDFRKSKFHQDHIHPAVLFTDANLRKNGILEENWKKWKYAKDLLPNLQLLEGIENIKKGKTPFKEWINTIDDEGNCNIKDIDKYKVENYIPNEIVLDFSNFQTFFTSRKNILRKEIKRIILK